MGVKTEDREELMDELEDVKDTLAQAAGRLEQLEEALTGATRERLRQVRAQVEIAVGEDHEWVGGSKYTLSRLIDEIDALTDEEGGEEG